MMKFGASLILLLFLLSYVSAIRINEVEMNPSGMDIKNEWIEIYNDGGEEIDISNWKMYDGLPQKIFTIPNGTLIDKGDYYLIGLNKSYLNNDKDGDLITLENSEGERIDETSILKDTIDNNNTHQFCLSEWVFAEQTKGQENNCAIVQENISQETSDNQTIQQSNSSENQTTIQQIQENNSLGQEIGLSGEIETIEKPIIADVIKLNPKPKDIKTNNNLLTSDNLAIYGLVAFSILLVFLFARKKIKKSKTEFKE